MKRHADRLQRAVVHSEELPWVDSPMPGVQRRMLERDGGEVARATSVVRYAPHSRFSPHVHGGGEEILVLDGVFSDEHGDFGPGMYLRNPVGSRHAPHTAGGCIILVKLWQMDPADQAFVRIDTRAAPWPPGAAPGTDRTDGIDSLALHTWGDERVCLQRWAPGTRRARHAHPGGEEVFVIHGSLRDDQGHYPRGAWIRNPHGSAHAPFTDEGCLLYVKTGHLPRG